MVTLSVQSPLFPSARLIKHKNLMLTLTSTTFSCRLLRSLFGSIFSIDSNIQIYTVFLVYSTYHYPMRHSPTRREDILFPVNGGPISNVSCIDWFGISPCDPMVKCIEAKGLDWRVISDHKPIIITLTGAIPVLKQKLSLPLSGSPPSLVSQVTNWLNSTGNTSSNPLTPTNSGWWINLSMGR